MASARSMAYLIPWAVPEEGELVHGEGEAAEIPVRGVAVVVHVAPALGGHEQELGHVHDHLDTDAHARCNWFTIFW